MSRFWNAVRGFLHGFVGIGVGVAPLGRDAESVRHALEQRAAGRKSCC